MPVAPVVEVKTPQLISPSIVDALAQAKAALREKKDAHTKAVVVLFAAKEAEDMARAALNAARNTFLKQAADLAEGDLDDNFISLTDDEADELRKSADRAKVGFREHVQSKLFEGSNK